MQALSGERKYERVKNIYITILGIPTWLDYTALLIVLALA